ncbi:MAG: hypothetical protein DMG59_18985, partial [Acidobacteria bacterium]
MLFWSIVPLLAATLAQDAQFTRESNGYWKRTTSGVVVTAPQSRLRVMTHGRIVLRGSAGDQVTYRLVERVKARTPAEAHRLLGSVSTTTRTSGDMTMLVVEPTVSPNLIIELQVNVPRYVTGAILDTQL